MKESNEFTTCHRFTFFAQCAMNKFLTRKKFLSIPIAENPCFFENAATED